MEPEWLNNVMNLEIAVAAGSNMDMMRLLPTVGREINRETYILMVAAKSGHVDMLRYALDDEFHMKSTNPAGILQYALLAA